MSRISAAATGNGRLLRWFPEREFIYRSRGQVRFIKLTSRAQAGLAALALALIVSWVAAMAALGWAHYATQASRTEVLAEAAQVEAARAQVRDYRQDVASVARELAQRQQFLENVVDALPADALAGGTDIDSATNAASDRAEPVTATRRISAAPGGAALIDLERRQLALVARLTRYAESEIADSEQAIRQLGLNPATIAASAREGMGGPFEALMPARSGAIDPRFARLGRSLARMDALDRGLAAIPQVAPAHVEMVSSSYGLRRDPFTGATAMHSGLDFRGPHGAPIYAAAAGRVSFVGTKSGYGNVVEITHGNGMLTRYAHMSRFAAWAGQEVSAGSVIGAIGSTGRSTGPHLHFEVRVNDRAVNPRPFLEAGARLLED